MNAMGGNHILRCVDRPGVTGKFIHRVPLIKSLIEAQPYIERVECSEDSVDVDLVPFRRFHSSSTTLVAAQATEAQLQLGFYPPTDGSEPWLFVEPDDRFNGRVIIARSPRYNNPNFPWSQIISFYGDRLLFVGLPEEHKSFVREFGSVRHLKVKDFLEMARAIAGASLFIGNQSSPHAVALGLGVRMISEVCLEQPDCLYRRDNVQYVADGACVLPDILGTGISLTVPKKLQAVLEISKDIVPPGFWQYPGLPPATHFHMQQRLVAQLENCSIPEAEVKLARFNVERSPEFFAGSGGNQLDTFNQAMKKMLDTASFSHHNPKIQPATI